MSRPKWVMVVPLVFVILGCQATRTAYYDAWEKMGYAKRERLVDYVKKARAEQVEAKEEFSSALDEFKSVVSYQGGDLEKAYKKLKSAYDDCEDQADDVNSRITGVKNVSKSLFAEWEGEIKEMKDESLKGKSRDLLERTKKNYDAMISRMDAAAATMQPVLDSFKDRVLYLKANLNAQAIASLKDEEMKLGNQIDDLIAEMEKSITEADEFIREMQPAK